MMISGLSNDPSRGGGSRPMISTANTAPSTIPTMHTLQQTQSPALAMRGPASHSYSYSSPTNQPCNNDGQSIGHSTFSAAPTPTSANTLSPLGLADIRSNSTFAVPETPMSAYANDRYKPEPGPSTYISPWPIYAMDWRKRPVQNAFGRAGAGRIVVGSYIEDGHNYINVLETELVPEGDIDPQTGQPQQGIEFLKVGETGSNYPITRILWEPETSQQNENDLLATSGDHLRLWSLPHEIDFPSYNSRIGRAPGASDFTPSKLSPLALLSNSKTPDHTAPLTSLDWNVKSPNLIITSSIDTTCTVWDIPKLMARTQLIAHDKEVFDVRFCADTADVFVSCGADGSVRMFDLRNLDHSTIIYEPSDKHNKELRDLSPTRRQQIMTSSPPLVRLSTSPHDYQYCATFAQDSNIVRILDSRRPGQALYELHGHGANINCVEWSKSTRGLLGSGADDSMVLLWDMLNAPPVPTNTSHSSSNTAVITQDPMSMWHCGIEVNNLSWAPYVENGGQQSEWMACVGGRALWAVNLS